MANRVLDRHAPQKKRYIRANQKPFITSELNKAVMNRSQLRNRYLKLHTSESKIAYTENVILLLTFYERKRKFIPILLISKT